LGHTKADVRVHSVDQSCPSRVAAQVVKLVESSPEISAQIKKVRGGYLKIQVRGGSLSPRRHDSCCAQGTW
jgi:hypothetical protein